MKKNAFAKSVATCHVLESIFMCFSNDSTSHRADSSLQSLSRTPLLLHTGELNRGVIETSIPASLSFLSRVALISVLPLKWDIVFLFTICLEDGDYGEGYCFRGFHLTFPTVLALIT